MSALDSLVLAGRSMDAHVSEAITSVEFEHGLEQAATLTLGLHDPNRVLVRSKIARERITARLGAETYVLVQVSKSGSDLTLTFEDQVVNALRQITGALKMNRSTVSRAGFARRLVLDPLAASYVRGRQIAFWSPEHASRSGRFGKTAQGKPLPPGQPHVAKGKATSSKVVPDVAPAKVTFATAALTVDGAPADANQRENATICLTVAERMGASDLVLTAMIETLIVESLIRNLTGGDRNSVGLFQQQADQGWHGLRNREEATREFTSRAIRSAAAHPTWLPGQVAQDVQRSAYPARYEQTRAEADKWLKAWRGEVGARGGVSATSPDRLKGASGTAVGYEFSRGADETSWDAVKRLADDLQWRAFVADGTVVFAPDSALIAQPVALRITERTVGVDAIDFDWDAGKRAARAAVTLDLDDRSALEPGQVVRIDDLGVADGPWLISDVRYEFLGSQMTLDLVRAQPALPEPPDEETTSDAGSSTFTLGKLPIAGGPGERAVAWASQFLGKPYVWGGGHGASGIPALVAYGNSQLRSYTSGFDCSGLSRCAWAQQGVNVGGTTTDQIARAKSAGVPHGTGTPPGGWQAGDLNYPHEGHVVLMTGKGVGAVEAKGHAWGIVADDRGPSYFWARWSGAAS